MPAPVQARNIGTESPKPLSFWVKPLIWLHRFVSGDRAQRREWSKRIEVIEQSADIDREPSTEGKAILSDLKAWRQIKTTGLIGASGGMALGAVWMSWLLPMYAIGHGFGWLAASAYLLPVPFAWSFGRRLWEKAALQGMKELGPNPSPQQQLRTLSAGMLRGMAAGAGMGFSLVFLQALISWFMTPADTIVQEIILDLVHGSMGAVLGATVGAVFGPLVGRAAPGSSTPPPARLIAEPKPE